MEYVIVDWEAFDDGPLGTFNKEQPCRVVRRLEESEVQIIVSNVSYEHGITTASLRWWVPAKYCKDVPTIYNLLLRV